MDAEGRPLPGNKPKRNFRKPMGRIDTDVRGGSGGRLSSHSRCTRLLAPPPSLLLQEDEDSIADDDDGGEVEKAEGYTWREQRPGKKKKGGRRQQQQQEGVDYHRTGGADDGIYRLIGAPGAGGRSPREGGAEPVATGSDPGPVIQSLEHHAQHQMQHQHQHTLGAPYGLHQPQQQQPTRPPPLAFIEQVGISQCAPNAGSPTRRRSPLDCASCRARACVTRTATS